MSTTEILPLSQPPVTPDLLRDDIPYNPLNSQLRQLADNLPDTMTFTQVPLFEEIELAEEILEKVTAEGEAPTDLNVAGEIDPVLVAAVSKAYYPGKWRLAPYQADFAYQLSRHHKRPSTWTPEQRAKYKKFVEHLGDDASKATVSPLSAYKTYWGQRLDLDKQLADREDKMNFAKLLANIPGAGDSSGMTKANQLAYYTLLSNHEPSTDAVKPIDDSNDKSVNAEPVKDDTEPKIDDDNPNVIPPVIPSAVVPSLPAPATPRPAVKKSFREAATDKLYRVGALKWMFGGDFKDFISAKIDNAKTPRGRRIAIGVGAAALVLGGIIAYKNGLFDSVNTDNSALPLQNGAMETDRGAYVPLYPADPGTQPFAVESMTPPAPHIPAPDPSPAFEDLPGTYEPSLTPDTDVIPAPDGVPAPDVAAVDPNLTIPAPASAEPFIPGTEHIVFGAGDNMSVRDQAFLKANGFEATSAQIDQLTDNIRNRLHISEADAYYLQVGFAYDILPSDLEGVRK